LSYYFLAASGGGTGDGEEYTVGREFIFSWGVYAGVAAEFTYLWGILQAVQAQFTYLWKVIVWGVSKQFTYKWNIVAYLEREFTFLWGIYDTVAGMGGKVKYSFRTSAVVNRFFRTFRNG
jgi:hypothetical protein